MSYDQVVILQMKYIESYSKNQGLFCDLTNIFLNEKG